MNVVDHGMDLQEAIDAPRIHHQWLPTGSTSSRTALSPDTLRILAGQGYDVGIDPDWTIWGEAAGILVGGRDLARDRGRDRAALYRRDRQPGDGGVGEGVLRLPKRRAPRPAGRGARASGQRVRPSAALLDDDREVRDRRDHAADRRACPGARGSCASC